MEREGLPYEEQSHVALRAECERRGLIATGMRTTLIARLKNHDGGAPALTSDLAFWFRPMPEPLQVARGAAPVYPTGQNMLLDLPHAVLRTHLCRRLTVEQLLACLYTCSYLFGDVLAELHARAVVAHGPRGNPLSLTAQLFYERLRDTRWAKLGMVTRTRNTRAAMNRRGIVSNDLVLHHSPMAVKEDICYTLELHGSLQQAVAAHVKKGEVRVIKKRERETADTDRRARFEEVADFLDHHGYPGIFTNFSAAKRLERHRMASLCDQWIVRHLKNYILQGSSSAYAKAKAEITSDVDRMHLLAACFPIVAAADIPNIPRNGITQTMIINLGTIIEMFISFKACEPFSECTGIGAIVETYCIMDTVMPVAIWLAGEALPVVCPRSWYTRGAPTKVYDMGRQYSGRMVAVKIAPSVDPVYITIDDAVQLMVDTLAKNSGAFICMRML